MERETWTWKGFLLLLIFTRTTCNVLHVMLESVSGRGLQVGRGYSSSFGRQEVE